ncbi:PE-PGRS family protein [Streptomyces sp. NPDC058439]|uniref:PE-PGRS family protein n=1 Tax=Streptomyces sp. NPDC058439 TaxID=3346500 RepID=UPI00365626C3
MRNVNADDLDQLAKLIDGKGGLGDKLAEAMTRASALGVSDRLAPIKPMRTWVTDTAPDMRTRATKVRAETLYERGHRETYSDWLMRIEGHYLAKVPGLSQFGEKGIEDALNKVSDVGTFIKVGGGGLLYASILGTNIFQNSWHNGLLRKAVNKGWLTNAARMLPAGKLRSLTAPGSWLPGKLGNAFSRSSLYQDLIRIPGTSSIRGDLLGSGWNRLRGLPGVGRIFSNGIVDAAIGSDIFAKAFGGVSHSGAAVTRAGHASLWKVFSKASKVQRFANSIPGAARTVSPWLTGLKTAGKTAGVIRLAGVGMSAISTGVSFANVWAQGNPHKAFKEKGAGYVADVAEVGFNASLTASMIAPNPVTIGLTVGFGAVYAGAKIVENWDDIKAGAGKAAGWVGDKASKVGSGIANGAKSLAKKANPMNWF